MPCPLGKPGNRHHRGRAFQFLGCFSAVILTAHGYYALQMEQAIRAARLTLAGSWSIIKVA